MAVENPDDIEGVLNKAKENSQKRKEGGDDGGARAEGDEQRREGGGEPQEPTADDRQRPAPQTLQLLEPTVAQAGAAKRP